MTPRAALDRRPVDRAKARRAIDRAVALAPDNATVVATAPEVYLALGDHAAAWKALQRQAAPDATLVGQCLLRLGREREAVEILRGAVAETRGLHGRGGVPEFVYAMQMNNAGYVLADAGVELGLAEQYLKAAVDMLPTDTNCADSLGWLRFRQGRFAEAVFYLERAVRLQAGPVHAEVLYHLGTAYARHGNPGRAAKLLRRALAQDPGLNAASDELRRVNWRLPEPRTAGDTVVRCLAGA